MPDFSAQSLMRSQTEHRTAAEQVRQQTETIGGSAALGDPAAIQARGPLLLGRFQDHLLTYGGSGHLLTFAPTGAGKGVSVVVPNLIDYPGSVVCIDPKGAIAPITAAHRAARGQRVILLDPFAEVERAVASRGQAGRWPDLPRASYNPLGHLDKNSPDVVDEVRLIASSLIMQENEKNRYFSDSARMILEAVILHLLSQQGRVTLGDVFADAFDTRENFVKSTLPEMRDHADYSGHVAHIAGQIENLTRDVGANIWSTLYRSLNLIKSPRLLPAMQPPPAGAEIDFRSLKNPKTPATVYLVLPAKHLNTHGAWLRLMLGIIIDQLSDARRTKHPVLFIVDECATLGRLEILETAVGLMRGYGLKLWLIFQDLPQLKSIYAGRWQSFVSNAGVKQFFNVNDLETADFVSQYMGNQTLRVQSENISGQNPLPNSSISATGRPLRTPDEVRRLPTNEQILFYEGEKPLIVDKLCYYADRYFRDKATGAKKFLDDPYNIS